MKEREKRKLKDDAGFEKRVPTRYGQLDNHLDFVGYEEDLEEEPRICTEYSLLRMRFTT